MKIVSCQARDIRFPTSRLADGSDAMNPDPDYSAAYVTLATDDRAAGCSLPLGVIERQKFYDRVRRCYVVVATGEGRLYGNLILTKGVIRPEADPGPPARAKGRQRR